MIDTPLPSQANQETHEAQVISDHLPEGYSADFDGRPYAEPSSSQQAASSGDPAADDSAGDSDSNHQTSSLKLQGGDIHRGIFKTASRIKYHRRTATFHYPPSPSLRGEGIEGLTVNNQLAPGGFRRAFLLQKQQDKVWGSRLPIPRNFVEFLDLYGSFAGEDLADSDEEAIDDEEDDDGGMDAGPFTMLDLQNLPPGLVTLLFGPNGAVLTQHINNLQAAATAGNNGNGGAAGGGADGR